MATPTLLVVSLIIGGLLFAVLVRIAGRRPKRDVPGEDDSPFADLIAKNRTAADALPGASRESPAKPGADLVAGSTPATSAASRHSASSFEQLEPLLLADLRAGNKITAIKRLRDATGLGLKEAKEAVERFHATGLLDPHEMHPHVLAAQSHQRAATSLDDPAVAELARAFLARGQKIQAVKAVREMTNCGLKEAKDFVERL